MAKYYQRPRETPYEAKPTIEAVFALKGKAAAQGLAIQKLYLSTEELKSLETEIRALAADVNFYKLKNPYEGIANFIGVRFEVLNSLDDEIHTSVDKTA